MKTKGLGYVMIFGPALVALGAVVYACYVRDGWTGVGIFVGAILIGYAIVGSVVKGIELLNE